MCNRCIHTLGTRHLGRRNDCVCHCRRKDWPRRCSYEWQTVEAFFLCPIRDKTAVQSGVYAACTCSLNLSFVTIIRVSIRPPIIVLQFQNDMYTYITGTSLPRKQFIASYCSVQHERRRHDERESFEVFILSTRLKIRHNLVIVCRWIQQ